MRRCEAWCCHRAFSMTQSDVCNGCDEADGRPLGTGQVIVDGSVLAWFKDSQLHSLDVGNVGGHETGLTPPEEIIEIHQDGVGSRC